MRNFSAANIIQLPRLTAEDTVTLVRQLETAAGQARSLPAAVTDALEELKSARDALARELHQRALSASAADGPRAREADRYLDQTWAALRTWLLGWTSLDDADHANVADAKRIYGALFPDGLAFINRPYRTEWAETELRLTLIAKEKFGPVLEALGGRAFLQRLRKAQREYGEALAVTASPTEPTVARVADVMALTHEALRHYIAEVAVSARRSRAGQAELLLAPVTQWVPKTRRETLSQGEIHVNAPVAPSPGSPADIPTGGATD